jgi:tetratricopeptide (TPR) repeat protein
MAKKKQTQLSISQDENEQVQSILGQYHQIATQLRASTDEQQVGVALAEINNMPAGAQIAFLKELAREQHLDAADVLAALYAFGTLKDGRKEARRSLIRLEGARIYPRWEAPPTSTPADSLLPTTAFPPRFFKGQMTDSRESGEMQLILAWEMGEDYREVRVLGFLLEFWRDGIKDFFTLSETRRSFANLLSRMSGQMNGIPLKECSLNEGIVLLEEAKAVNARSGTKPHRDYTSHRALIDQLLPENLALEILGNINLRNWDEELEDEDEDEVDLSNLTPQDVVANFVEAEINGDLSIAYQILAQDSPLREGLTRDAWIERRDEWAEKFDPVAIEPNLLYTREPQKPKLWLPAPLSKQNDAKTKEVEAGWSVELAEILLEDGDKLPEIPTPVCIYAETKRHWFWASFTLVQENNVWHIQHMTDEYLKGRDLPLEVIKKRIEELRQGAEKAALAQTPEQIKHMNEAEQQQYIEATLLPMEQALYYTDILVGRELQDRSLYEDAAAQAMVLGQRERSLIYLQALLERFPEGHALIHQRIAELQQDLALEYAEEDDDEREIFYLNQAEKSLIASLALEENVDAHLSLAEVLLEQDDRLNEAKSHLLQAQGETNDPEVEAHIEMHLGEIAQQQEQMELALNHFQRAVELQPTNADYWETLGGMQQTLEDFSEAEISYQRAIELDPYNINAYSVLGLLYRAMDQDTRAIQALKDGLVANPESVALHLYLAGAYQSINDFQQSEDFLDKAERLEPDSEVIAAYRETLALSKLSQTHAEQKPLRLAGPKKKKKHHR